MYPLRECYLYSRGLGTWAFSVFKKAILANTSTRNSRGSEFSASAINKKVTIDGEDLDLSNVLMLISDPPILSANSGCVSPAISLLWRNT